MKSIKPIKAFSLIELSITVLIIGIVTLVALNGKSLVIKANCVASSLGSKTIVNNLDNPSALTANRSSAYETCVSSGGANSGSSVSSSATSCKAILDANPGSASGIYTINPAGNTPFQAYCDMTNNGGGWTLVVAQYEDSPVTNWNQGINTTTFVAPTAAMLDNCGNVTTSTNGCDQVASAGFVLNTSQIPTHTQTAFGKGSNATFIGYSNFVYTTGDIAKTLLTNIKDSNNTYHVHRSTSGYYGNHNPEGGFVSSPADVWSNTLTYDKTGGALFSWAFSAMQTSANSRSYSTNADLQSSSQSYSWTVWVR